MRTKNAKRLWPVPATLAVMALVALLAFGLMATTGAQPAAAQDGADCTVTISTANGGDDGVSIDSGESDLTCNAFGGAATIEFVGPGGDPGSDKEIPVYVLVEDKGGNLSFYDSNDVWQSENADPRRKGAFYEASGDNMVAKPTKYSDQDVSVPRATRQGGRFVAQSATITVEGEGTVHVFLPEEYDDGIVRNFAETASDYAPDCSPACSATVRPPSSAQKFISGAPANDSHEITITFLGRPSLTQDDTALLYNDDADDNTDAVDPNDSSETDPASALGAFKSATPAATTNLISSEEDSSNQDLISADRLTDYADDLWVQKLEDDLVVKAIPNLAVDDTSNKIFIIAEVRDSEGNPLSGGSNVDSGVTFDVSFHADSDLKSVARFEYTEPKTVNTSGRASIELTGWTTNDDPAKVGPVRVTVTATYTGPSGTLDLGKVELARVGDPATLTTGTYSCAPVVEGEKDAKKDGCPPKMDDDSSTLDVDESVPATNSAVDTVFGREDIIVVKATLTDALGSKSSETIDVELSNAAKDILTQAPEAAEGALIRYIVDDEADLEMYADAITVSYGAGDDLIEEKLSFTVSGAAENFMFDNPAMYIGLSTGTSQVFTITGTDEEGNVPSEPTMVEVVVLGVASSYVSGIGTDNMLEIKDGTGSFEVFTPVDAAQGDTALILVRVDGNEVARHAIMFGEEMPDVVEPGPEMMEELMAPMDVNTGPFNRGGVVQVNWTAVQNAAGYIVIAVNQGAPEADTQYEVVNDGSDETVTLSGLSSGSTYDIYVVSTAKDDYGFPEMAQTMVTAN